MKFAIIGAGAVGGYYGARLARAGHDVTFIARGSHLEAIRDRGISIKSSLGDFTIAVPATDDPSSVGIVDVAILAVKSYDNDSALELLPPLIGDDSVVLTLQNGVDSVDEIAAVVGAERVLGGATYIATAVVAPGVIEQTGTHRRIVFGEMNAGLATISARVNRIHEAFAGADIDSEPVADARIPLWTKFIYLAPFAGFTGAARVPIGPLWSEPQFREVFLAATREVESIARAEGVNLPASIEEGIVKYAESLPPSTRSSLLIDLQQGKRIELEALPGSVVRRGAAAGVPTPIMSALYAVLKPHAAGARQ